MGVDDQIRELTEAVQELRDREEIRELFNRYGFSADTGDAKAWSEVYSEDGLYDYARGEIRGRAAFYDTIENPDCVHKRDIEGPGSLHTTGALTIRVDGLTAWAEGHTLVCVTTGPGPLRRQSPAPRPSRDRSCGPSCRIVHCIGADHIHARVSRPKVTRDQRCQAERMPGRIE